MPDGTDQTMAAFEDALRRAWCRETSASPDEWTPEDPALRQCEVSSFLAWEHFGGELVLGQVFVDDVMQEHHYWNRIDGADVDLTAEQFRAGEEIRELHALTQDQVRAKIDEIRPELRERIDLLRERLDAALAGE